MSRVRPPENIDIAALRKQQQTVFDPMTSGPGTPWEDRATHGTIGAFFKTCGMALTAPAKLMNAIRRPETINDARAFLIGICSIWGITALGHFAWFVWLATEQPDAELDTANALVLGALMVAGAGVGSFFLFKIYNLVYSKLTEQEKNSALLPDVLLYNVNAYALGPSLLALIPLAGPVIALIWIYVALVIAGSSRLRLRVPAAIIDALISLAVVVGIIGAVYLIVEVVLFQKIMHYTAVDVTPPPALGR